MSASSIVALVVVVALVAFAVWRDLKKGAPCSCGCDEDGCGCGCGCCGKRQAEEKPTDCA